MNILQKLNKVFLSIIAVLALSATIYSQNGGISIGKGGMSPHPSSVLEINSDSKGVLFPRLTTSQRESISNLDNADGLIVYDIDKNSYYYYSMEKGGSWIMVQAGEDVGIEEVLTTNNNAGKLSIFELGGIHIDTLKFPEAGEIKIIGITGNMSVPEEPSDSFLVTHSAIRCYVDAKIESDTSNIEEVLKKGSSANDNQPITGLTDVGTSKLTLSGTGVTGISTDGDFTSASDNSLSTQLAIKTYIDNNAGGNIEETLAKGSSANDNQPITGLTDVGTSKLTLSSRGVIGISINGNFTSASNDSLSTQLAIKNYVDGAISGGAVPEIKQVLGAGNDADNQPITGLTDVGTSKLTLSSREVIGISINGDFTSASDDSLSTQLAIKNYVDAEIEADTSDIEEVLKKGDDANGQNLVGLNTLNAETILAKNLVVEETPSSTTPSFYVESDRRVKADIQTIESAIETIMSLRPVKFKYKENWAKAHGFKDRYYYSFIAQEFKKVFPDDVMESGLYLEGDDKSVMRINVSSSQIVTIKAVQELVEKNRQLEEKYQILEEQNNYLKAELEAIKSLLLDRVEK